MDSEEKGYLIIDTRSPSVKQPELDRDKLRNAAAKLLREMRRLADVYIDFPEMKRPRNGLIDSYPRNFRIGASRCLNMFRAFCKENL